MYNPYRPVYTAPVQQQVLPPVPVAVNPYVSSPYAQQYRQPAYQPITYQQAAVLKQQALQQSNPKINSMFTKLIQANSPDRVKKTDAPVRTNDVNWKNDLRQLFRDNKAVIYAMIPRTFNAKDLDGDELIDTEKGEQQGTFINAIERLDELKRYGINTLHILPIHPPGKKQALGTAGSVYAPANLLEIDPVLDDKNDPRNVKEEAKEFIKECHKRDIRVMIDLPSCFSVDMYEERPELAAIDSKGYPKVPQGWEDIRMMEPWADEDKRVLNKALVDEHKKWIDLVQEIGADGVRADVGRAKPVEFWNEIISYSREKDPNFALLAETYVNEDASPMMNMPFDRPQDLLNVGFDSYYGQYHIFPHMNKAQDLLGYVAENLEMSHKLKPGKSLIGSFATHDDNSPMSNGGAPYCNLTTGLQMTLPMTNPYFVTGFESGDRYLYPYKDSVADKSMTDSFVRHVNPQWVDIFNLSRKPGGNNPEIGDYMASMSKIRKNYEDVITKGSFIPLKVENNEGDKIIAYARHYNGKTLLAVANRDVNARQSGTVIIPGMQHNQPLRDLTPHYGVRSNGSPIQNGAVFDLGPARFHLFEINTPNIERDAQKVYRQNL